MALKVNKRLALIRDQSILFLDSNTDQSSRGIKSNSKMLFSKRFQTRDLLTKIIPAETLVFDAIQ